MSWDNIDPFGVYDHSRKQQWQSTTNTETEKATLERRIDELCAEVERGKADFKKMDVWHSQELKAAMDENAKLRELVDELYPLADYGAMDASELDRAHDLMRELGIEVPS